MSSGLDLNAGQSLQATDLQPLTLAVFTVLARLREDWGGALIVSIGLGPLGSAVALAASVAGAACLSIDPDRAVCRAAMRAGACDFLVNTVDESLRVLKNEIRQRKPLSVGLELGATAALGELLERGVLPQVFTSASGVDDQGVVAAARDFAKQGSRILDCDGLLSGVAGCIRAQETLDATIQCSDRMFRSLLCENLPALRRLDARLLEVLAEGIPERRWAVAAPRLFRRDRPLQRVTFLTAEETRALEPL